jgi:hypothetical protein
MRATNKLRWTGLVMALVLAVVPAAASAEPGEPGDPSTIEGHEPDDPEELGAGGHDHDHDFERDIGLDSVVGAGTLGPYFNESGGCADPAGIAPPMSTTNSSANRSLPSGHQVRGPWGDFYGRDYSDVSGSMVRWTVPMSGGKTVYVHQRALPAFEEVTRNLAAEEANGNYYDVRLAGTWVWRRVGGSYRMSTHSFGATIDINSDTNPYSSNNVLITDMPAWFVKAWTDAGFCWGGDWQNIKDAMHFSWKGPLRTPDYGDIPAPYAPTTPVGTYTQVAFSGTTTFERPDEGAAYFFGDGNADAAPDLFRVRTWADNDLLVEYARSSRDFLSCGVSQAVVPGAGTEPGELMVADYDGDTRPDVWRIDASGADVKLIVHTYAAEYQDRIRITTGAASTAGASFGTADYDRDGAPDLYVIERLGETRVRVFSGASDFSEQIINADTRLGGTPDESRWHHALADVDVDGIPDVVVMRVDDDVELKIMYGDDGYTGAIDARTTGVQANENGLYSMGDWDGDGRPDVLSYRPNGFVQVHLGGVQTGSSDFWFQNAGWTCEGTGSLVPWDVNGDRIGDLVVGVPFDDVGGAVDAGLVNLIYGSGSGPVSDSDELWHQNSAGVEGDAETRDRFGTSMTWGDFDNDGIGDLAIGAPYDDVGSVPNAGLLNVFYGTRSGLTGTGSQLISQETPGIQGTAQKYDRFSDALAAGDFNGDGWDDLAVGAPNDLSTAGVVNVLYGTKLGLSDAGNQLWYQSAWGVPGESAPRNEFGAALAVGDFDADGYDDLAIGVPGNGFAGAPDAGLAIVLYGGAGGLTSSGSQRWKQQGTKISDEPDPGDRFGETLAAGDFDGDGFDDLAVGAPGEEVLGRDGAGQVHIIFGRDTGLSGAGDQIWHQSRGGMPGKAQKNDRFGAALAAGDTNNDGITDLAVGVPLENVAGAGNAGGVVSMFGTPGGLTADGAVLWRQGIDGLTATSEKGDQFGSHVRFADLNGDGYAELIVAMPREDLSVVDAGAVMVIYSGPNGVTTTGAEVWHQDAGGVEGIGDEKDRMGAL